MAKDHESTMQWKLDIANLKKGMQDARREISLANAEFKNATAGMGRWSDSAEGVEAKTRQLAKVLESQQTILKDLKDQYAIVAREMGETSPEAQKLKVQIENQEAACKKTQAQMGQYNDRLAELQAEEAKAQTPTAKLNDTIEDQEKQLADLKRQYADSIVGKNPEEADRLAREIEDLSGELAENKRAMSDAERAADELDRSIDDAGDSANEAAGGGFTVLKGALADLISSGIQKAIDFVSGLTSEAIASADALQKFEGTMGFAGFDAANIEAARDAVKKYADDTVYDLDTIANTTAQLAANGIEDYTGLTQAAGNLNAVAGGNADTFNSVAMMMTQTAGAGKLTTENWNQLADAIPGASGKLQEALRNAGAYTGDFREAMAEGQITADEFNAAIMELGNDPIAVEAATSVSTFEGAMGNLEATVVSGLMEIYEQIGSENITGFITTISDGIQAVIPYIQDAVQFVLDNKDPIIAALAGIAAGVAAISAIQGIMKMVGAFKTFFGIIKGGQGVVAAFNAVMGLNPFVLIAGAVVGLVAALVVLFNTNEDFRNKVIEIWGNVKEFVGNAIDAIGVFFTETLPAAIQVMIDWFSQLPGKVADFITQVWQSVSTWAVNMWNKAKELGQKFLSNIVTFFSQLPGRIASFASSVWSNIVTWAANMVSKALELGTKFLNNVVNFFSQLPYKVGYFIGYTLAAIVTWVANMVAKAKELGQKFLSNIVTFFSQLPGKVAGFVTTVWHNIVTWAANMWNKASELGRNFLNNIVSFFKQLPGKVADFIGDVLRKVGTWAGDMASKATSAGSDFINNVVDYVSNLPGKVWDYLSDVVSKVASWAGDLASNGASAASSLFNSVVDGIASLPDSIYSIGSNLVSGLWNGINDMTGWIIGKIQGFGSGVLDGIKAFFGIKSPSRVMRDEVGKMLAEGIAVGFGDEMPDALRSMQKSMGGTVDALKGSVTVAANGIAASGAHGGAQAASGAGDNAQTVIFNQYNNSPKALDRLTIYRETNSLLFSAKVGLKNV